MNKQELVEAVARATGQSKADIDRCLKGTLYNIAAALSRGEKVTFVGFGTFERRQRKARTGVNPQNPTERIKIPAKKAPAFSAGSELRAAVATGRLPKLALETIAKKKGSKSKGKSKKSKKRR
ncbi:MAG: HU family DNA-binding protein [Candidatus Melainabacteria bacterium]|nr:HU family DNA-binding protein [Candidatus Melainabacteria bacterium]MBI3309415.1 HU family DNA-binding protein [Candidatus Melainabacteria bacterium]